MLAASLVVLTADSDTVLQRMHRENPGLADQGLSDHAILVTLYVLCGVVLAWALASAAFATVLFLGQRWAWYALVASAGATTVLSLVGALGSLLLLVPLGGALATVACLVRPEVRAWLVSR
jgi:hypothetical protein